MGFTEDGIKPIKGIFAKWKSQVGYFCRRSGLEKLNAFFKEQNFKHIAEAEFGDIKEMLKKARAENREGIIIKDMTASYYGCRNDGFRKCKFFEEAELKVTKFTENPKGIRVEDEQGNACQVAGTEQSKAVKNAIETNGYAEITIQYLERTAEGRFRFPSFRELKKGQEQIAFNVVEQTNETNELNELKAE